MISRKRKNNCKAAAAASSSTSSSSSTTTTITTTTTSDGLIKPNPKVVWSWRHNSSSQWINYKQTDSDAIESARNLGLDFAEISVITVSGAKLDIWISFHSNRWWGSWITNQSCEVTQHVSRTEIHECNYTNSPLDPSVMNTKIQKTKHGRYIRNYKEELEVYGEDEQKEDDEDEYVQDEDEEEFEIRSKKKNKIRHLVSGSYTKEAALLAYIQESFLSSFNDSDNIKKDIQFGEDIISALVQSNLQAFMSLLSSIRSKAFDNNIKCVDKDNLSLLLSTSSSSSSSSTVKYTTDEMQHLISETMMQVFKSKNLIAPNDKNNDDNDDKNGEKEKEKKEEEKEEVECCICLYGETNYTVSCCNLKVHKECIDQSLAVDGKCPGCRAFLKATMGSQPNGTMTISVISHQLAGFKEPETFQVSYNIAGGTQDRRHPRPGKSFYGRDCTMYLPKNQDGEDVLKLFISAFYYRRLFGVGDSLTSGASDTVIYSTIHQRSSMVGGPTVHGYPDPFYLRDVTIEIETAMGRKKQTSLPLSASSSLSSSSSAAAAAATSVSSSP